MIIKIKDKEYLFEGYENLINFIQKLAEDIYEQCRVDGAREFAEWLCSEECKYINGNNHFTTGIECKSIDEVLAEWQKGAENE